MKLIKFSSIIFLFLFAVSFSTVKAESNEEKLSKKIATGFVGKGNWILDFDEACKKAKEEKKPIFSYFTRSYAP